MSHIFGAKAKTKLGSSFATSGVIAGIAFSGPVGTIVSGTCSGLFSIVLNGIGKITCDIYGKRHEEKMKNKTNKTNQDMANIMKENDRELNGKITKLYVGWSKLNT